MIRKIILGFFLIILGVQQSFAQNFNATVNRNPIPEGETFVLTLELQDVDTQKTPDLSALSKDLTILSISNGYHTSIINGNISKSRQWNLVMMPNKNGDIVIPPIELEGYQTQPITLKVVSSGSMPNNSPKDKQTTQTAKFKMSGAVDNTNPYVQQQINYRLTILDAGGLQGEAPYFVTSNDDWVIKSLGQPEIETKVVDGKSLREIVFNYALFPQKSGELFVPAVKFSGYYLSKNTKADPFARFFEDDDFFSGFGLHDVFANKNQVDLVTKPILINVRPSQADNGWWLPAEKVILSSEFDSDHPQFKVGEAVSRTIYLKAVGVLDNQLPEIKFSSVTKMKQYPEKPITEMKIENGKVVTLAKISNVYIPSESGAAVLPEIKVNWFNTTEGKEETAVIPEYQIYVEPTADQNNTAEKIISQPQEKEELPKNNNTITQAESVQKSAYIVAIVSFVGGILIAIVVMAFIRAFRKFSDVHKKSVIEAAKAKDLHALREALIVWGTTHFPQHSIVNLQDVADAFQSEAFNKEMDKLRETLYAESQAQWDSENFLKIFQQLSKKLGKQPRKNHEPLPKLYK